MVAAAGVAVGALCVGRALPPPPHGVLPRPHLPETGACSVPLAPAVALRLPPQRRQSQ